MGEMEEFLDEMEELPSVTVVVVTLVGLGLLAVATFAMQAAAFAWLFGFSFWRGLLCAVLVQLIFVAVKGARTRG